MLPVACKDAKIEWPKVMECVPGESELLTSVGELLVAETEDSLKEMLEKLAREHGADAVICALLEVKDQWKTERGDREVEVQRAEDFLREVSAPR